MATISVKVHPRKKMDGTHAVRISIGHKQKSAFIATNFVVTDPSHIKGTTFVREKDYVRKTIELTKLVEEYRCRLEELGYIDGYTVVELKQLITSQSASKKDYKINALLDERIAMMEDNNREGYADMIRDTQKRWNKYMATDLMVQHITPIHIENFNKWLRKNKYSTATIGMSLAQIKATINWAIKRQLVEYKVHPFATTEIRKSAPRELELSVEDFRKIYNYVPTCKYERLGKDMFLLSFYTGGAIQSDIIRFSYKKKADTITYTRYKTRNRTVEEISITLPVIAEARKILDKYTDKDGFSLGYKFAEKNLSNYIGGCVRKTTRKIGLENICIYTARKAFSQYALDLGFPDSTIDACLGHANSSRGVISYYNKVRVQQMKKCIQDVADFVKE